jgi:hypothetical protein
MNKHLATLMQKEMTRKEFLMTLGFGIATVFGFGSLIRVLTGKQAITTPHESISSGYGSNVYGGRH